MPFTFKLSMRLALIRAALVPVAAAAFVTSELPGRRVTDPNPNNVVVQVFISPDSITLDPYETQQFLAFGRTQAGDSVPVAVRWSTSGGTITTGGLYTADASFGTYKVTATATTSAVTSSSTVRNRGQLTQVFITPSAASVAAGGTRQFGAYGRKRNGDSVAVNVSYAATGGIISAAGLYSAGQSAGSYQVIAVSNPAALADTAAVTISVLPVASVAVTRVTGSVAVGQTVSFTATPEDANGNALSGRVVTWVSSGAAVATVDGNGQVTGVTAGLALITATSEGQSGTALITVTAPVVVTNPAQVTDLAVASVTDTSMTLSFLQVDDGTGQPASYIVKYGVGTLAWSTGLAVTRGTCVTPVVGTAIGTTSSCTVLGLTPATAYQFGIVAFRGDVNTNAVFGPLSNLASGTTAVIPPGTGGVLFESDWSTALGSDPVSALRDGGRWSWEADWGGGKIMSVVPGGPGGHNALRVVQRGGSFAAFIGKNNLMPPSTDYYVRHYMRNDHPTTPGDHVVTPH